MVTRIGDRRMMTWCQLSHDVTAGKLGLCVKMEIITFITTEVKQWRLHSSNFQFCQFFENSKFFENWKNSDSGTIIWSEQISGIKIAYDYPVVKSPHFYHRSTTILPPGPNLMRSYFANNLLKVSRAWLPQHGPGFSVRIFFVRSLVRIIWPGPLQPWSQVVPAMSSYEGSNRNSGRITWSEILRIAVLKRSNGVSVWCFLKSILIWPSGRLNRRPWWKSWTIYGPYTTAGWVTYSLVWCKSAKKQTLRTQPRPSSVNTKLNWLRLDIQGI